MQIVIDIPKDRYDEIHSLKFVMYGLQSEENRKLFYRLINAVQDGTILPEHGDLVDRSEIEVEEDVYNQTYIIHAPTILKATKESNNAE